MFVDTQKPAANKGNINNQLYTYMSKTVKVIIEACKEEF